MVTVSEVRKKSRDDKKTTAERKSYRKDSYTYTESSPGSNRFQNFSAKTVSSPAATAKRKAIQSDKKPSAKAPAKKSYPARQGGMDTGNVMKSQEQRFRPAPASSGPRRGGARAGTPAKPDTSKYVFSPMMGKMVPRGKPTTPTKKPSSLSEMMKRNWEKYRPKTGAGR